MTVRITLKDKDGSKRVLLFGDSYKPWNVQFEEHVWRYFSNNKESGWKFRDEDVRGRVLKAEISRSPWISYGGLKWCIEGIFQAELDAEGAGLGRTPRQYKDFRFTPYKGKKLDFYM